MTLGERPPAPSLDIHADTSMKGWGFHTSEEVSKSGHWFPQFQKLHINILELATVYIAINSLQVQCGSHIRVHCNNSTTVHCINRGSSAKSPVLNGWILSLQLLLRKKNWLLSAFHIAGVRNGMADALSTDRATSSEWILDSKSFNWICNLVPYTQIKGIAYFVAPF